MALIYSSSTLPLQQLVRAALDEAGSHHVSVEYSGGTTAVRLPDAAAARVRARLGLPDPAAAPEPAPPPSPAPPAADPEPPPPPAPAADPAAEPEAEPAPAVRRTPRKSTTRRGPRRKEG